MILGKLDDVAVALCCVVAAAASFRRRCRQQTVAPPGGRRRERKRQSPLGERATPTTARKPDLLRRFPLTERRWDFQSRCSTQQLTWSS